MGHAGKAAQSAANGVGREPARETGRRGGHRVLEVVGTAQAQLGGVDQRAAPPGESAGRPHKVGLGAGAEGDAAGVARERRDGCAVGEPRTGPGEGGRQHGRGAFILPGEDRELGREVAGHRGVAVEVVGSHVEQHGGLRCQRGGILELERGDLADDGRVARERTGERAGRGADVAGEGVGQPGLAVDVGDQVHRRGLAVRACDGEELVAEQPPGELELADYLDAALAGGLHDRGARRHAGAFHERADALELLDAVAPQVHLGARRRQLAGGRRGRTVDGDHLAAARA